MEIYITFLSTIFAVIVVIIIWRQFHKKDDVIKYEFINTIVHKIRTPLTHIKWACENLVQTSLSADAVSQVEYIQSANAKLVELTDLLVNASESEKALYEYHSERTDIGALIEDVLHRTNDHMVARHITLEKNISADLRVDCDATRIRFVIQTLCENAINYSPDDSTISIDAVRSSTNITVSVRDTGIGIDENEIPRIFTKFYRSQQARAADTEGMGVGLYIAKEIMAHHGGKIWVESDGLGKGSTFSFSLPTVVQATT